ncbi:MAG: 3-oxoadipate enol-lactonase [Actinomycetota bacterium]
MTAVVVHHVTHGPADAPVLVLAGSLGSTQRMWDPIVPTLAEHLRVVTYDARGHGLSPAPTGPYAIKDLADDLVLLLDTVGVERAHLGGLSMGGMTAMRLAARDPRRVGSMTLLCTSAQLGPAQGWLDRADAVRAGGVASVAPVIVERWLTPAAVRRDPALVASLVEMISSSSDHGYAACCEAIAEMDLRPDLASITAPTLAIAGEQDPATPPEHLRLIAEGIEGARLEVLSPAAHIAVLEQPAAVARLVLDHLAAHPV